MKQKRTKLEKVEGIQKTLEGYRRFDYDYIPFGSLAKVPDEKYRYRQPWYELIATWFWRTLMATIGRVAIRILYGAKTRGREHMRALKGQGAIVVCNHFSYLDTLFVRDAIGYYKSFHTMAPWNNKKGIGGHIIRHGGMWPISFHLGAMKNFNKEMERQLKKGAKINFYAEQAMWVNYQKPREMKEGAFFYAAKFNVPVLPVFCTFEKNKRGHVRKLRINILPPVYPEEGNTKAKMRSMKARAQEAWKNCYESAYNTKLEYEPDRRKNN